MRRSAPALLLVELSGLGGPINNVRLTLDRPSCGLTLRNADRAGLHRLRKLALQIDMQKAILKRRGGHFHIFRKAETALEIPRGDALVDILPGLLLPALFAADRQSALFHLKRKIGLAEARDSHGDSVNIIAQTLDIVRREAVFARATA